MSIGENQNQLKWGSKASIGKPGDDFKVRSYSRNKGQIRYYENGILIDSTTLPGATDFFQNWVQSYLGKTGASATGDLAGDIAEVIMYRGRMSDEERIRIEEYLFSEWGLEKPAAVSSLDGLSVNPGTLVPEFSTDVLDYSLSLPSGTSAITITATKTDLLSTVAGDGTIPVTKDTTQSIVVTSEDGSSTTTYTIRIELETNMEDIEVRSFRIYPNPVNDVLTLELNQGETAAYVKLINTTGNVVSEKYEHSPIIKIDTGALPEGMYYLSVRTNKHSVIQKIVKQ